MAFLAGVSNLVVFSKTTMLDVFMSAASLTVIMNIDDVVGEYFINSMGAQPNVLRLQIRNENYALANFFSTMVIFSFVTATIAF